MALSRKFAIAQTAALLRLGTPVQDVERTLKWLERTLPADADPATWLPTEAALDTDLETNVGGVQDARADWYMKSSVPKRFKRLLDAKGANG